MKGSWTYQHSYPISCLCHSCRSASTMDDCDSFSCNCYNGGLYRWTGSCSSSERLFSFGTSLWKQSESCMKPTHDRWKHCFVSFYFPSNRPIVRARVAPRRIVNITKRQSLWPHLEWNTRHWPKVLLSRFYTDWIVHTSCKSSELFDLWRTIPDVVQQRLHDQASRQPEHICQWRRLFFGNNPGEEYLCRPYRE